MKTGLEPAAGAVEVVAVDAQDSALNHLQL